MVRKLGFYHYYYYYSTTTTTTTTTTTYTATATTTTATTMGGFLYFPRLLLLLLLLLTREVGKTCREVGNCREHFDRLTFWVYLHLPCVWLCSGVCPVAADVDFDLLFNQWIGFYILASTQIRFCRLLETHVAARILIFYAFW